MSNPHIDGTQKELKPQLKIQKTRGLYEWVLLDSNDIVLAEGQKFATIEEAQNAARYTHLNMISLDIWKAFEE